jgi:unsaturated rhamnogalacturonyl hydrolase
MEKKTPVLICFACLIVFAAGTQAQTPMSQKMANTVMNNYPTRYTVGTKTWDYVVGTVMKGFHEVYQKTGTAAYLTYIQNTVDYEVNTNGTMKSYKVTDYSLDQVREGSSVLFLYQKTSLAKYKTAADLIRTQLNVGQHPRTSEGGFWHKQTYPYQMWQDGLYMAEPFYAEYSKVFHSSDTADLNDVVNQFTFMEKHARDTVTGLIYHGWDEKKVQSWADPVTGCSKSFWGRAMGWYAMALIDVLDYLPSTYAKRANLIAILQRLLSAAVAYQDPVSGCWYQVVDQGSRTGNYLESSASCMFVYSILKAVRLGYVNQSFLAAGRKGYNGLISTFIIDSSGNLTISQVCQSAGLSATRDGTFAYYISEPIVSNDGKAVGPFILASLEYESLPTGTIETKNVLPPIQGVILQHKGPALTILFTLNQNTPIKIGLCSLAGKETVLCGTRLYQSGAQSVSFDLSMVPKGMYLIQIESEHFAETRRLVLGH